ncbi:hypothetical protein GCK32_015595 [Trichostrongylus colubriformis]|uniref:Cation efflux protein transmembrane domain-containing protein n=1 Tax=Trichostrongylus colubriformis TaxID=6319 RepID=A0AAN8G3F9_TRICO
MSSLVFQLPASFLHIHTRGLSRRAPSLTRILVSYASCHTEGPPPGQKPKKQRLFKIARPSKRSRLYENDKIDKLRAMAEFGLREEHLRDLPAEQMPVKNTSYSSATSRNLYALTDVYHRALQVHGSLEALDAHRRPLIAMRKELTDAERMRMRMRVETTASTSKGADRVVAIAFTLNMCDAAFKCAAAYLTGSKSLFAEAIHSTMDTCNQLILLMGIRYSARNPDNLFPYGYG